MSKSTKILVGLLTVIPYLFLGLMFISFLSFPQKLLANEVQTILQVSTFLWVGSLLTFYLRHLTHYKILDREKRMLWGVVLVLGNVFMMPIYWYKYIWHAQTQPHIMQNDDGTQIIGL